MRLVVATRKCICFYGNDIMYFGLFYKYIFYRIGFLFFYHVNECFIHRLSGIQIIFIFQMFNIYLSHSLCNMYVVHTQRDLYINYC